MPISEDEYDSHRQQQHHALSKAEQRRSNKPIMEKRRRARINHCLNELKTLILDAMKKDPARHSKLEKADILEMTVRHLQSVQRQQLAVAVATDPAVLSKFRTGFSECAGEVGRYLGRLPGVEPAVRQRLSGHLSQCVAGLQQLDPNNNPGGGNTSAATSGLALVPHRLPTGEIALVLPPGLLPFPASATLQAAAASSTTTTTGTSNVTPGTTARPSAFTAVNPKVAPPPQPPSPLPSPTSTISDDDSLITEPYPRPPSPAVRPHQESACFKVPNFPLFPLTEEKPHQQPHVTSSTSDSASGSSSMTQMQQQQIVQTTPAVSAVAEVKVEFKTVPVVSTALYDSRPELHPPALPIDRPLTIVTRQDDNSIYASSTVTSLSSKTDVPIFPCKNALDFSLKREDYIHLNESPPVQILGASSKRSYAAMESGEEVMSSSLLMVQPPSKIPRLSFQVEVPNSGLHAVSASSPMVSASQDDATPGPSTSNTETTSSGSGKDMWRPW